MSKLPYFKFFPKDWLVDTSILTDEQKAIWIDLLCHLWMAEKRGQMVLHIDDVTQALRRERLTITVALDEMKRKGILEYKLDENQVCHIQSRRMLRDDKSLKNNAFRQKRHRGKRNAKVTHHVTPLSRQSNREKSEVRSQIYNTTYSPNGERDLTDLQKVVKGWKMLNDLPVGGDDSRNWDKVHFKRYAKSAKQLLELFGNLEGALDCMEYVHRYMQQKNLSCTIETIVKHSDLYREMASKGADYMQEKEK